MPSRPHPRIRPSSRVVRRSPGRRRPGRAVAAGLGALVLLVDHGAAAARRLGTRRCDHAAGRHRAAASSTAGGPASSRPRCRRRSTAWSAEGMARRLRAGARPAPSPTSAARCATFDGQRYCLGTGWTTVDRACRSPPGWPRSTPAGRERTGDLDPAAALAAGPPDPDGPRRRRARRADRRRPVRRQGLAAAPRDPGRAAAGRLRRASPRGDALHAGARHDDDQHPVAPAAASPEDRGRLPRDLHDPQAEAGAPAAALLLVRPGHGADDRLGLERRPARPGLLGRPARHHHRRHRDHRHGPHRQQTPAGTAPTTPARTSCSTSATSASSSGTC